MESVLLDFRKIFDTLPQGVAIQDEVGRVVYANSTAVRMVGLSSEKELLKFFSRDTVKDFIVMDEHGNPLPFEKLIGKRALLTGKNQERLIRFKSLHGKREHWFQVKSVSYLDNDNQFRGAINTF